MVVRNHEMDFLFWSRVYIEMVIRGNSRRSFVIGHVVVVRNHCIDFLFWSRVHIKMAVGGNSRRIFVCCQIGFTA